MYSNMCTMARITALLLEFILEKYISWKLVSLYFILMSYLLKYQNKFRNIILFMNKKKGFIYHILKYKHKLIDTFIIMYKNEILHYET